jgi:hypothetical protein
MNLLCLVPRHDVRDANLVETCEERKCREDDGHNDRLPFIEDLEDGWFLLQKPISGVSSFPLKAMMALNAYFFVSSG